MKLNKHWVRQGTTDDRRVGGLVGSAIQLVDSADGATRCSIQERRQHRSFSSSQIFQEEGALSSSRPPPGFCHLRSVSAVCAKRRVADVHMFHTHVLFGSVVVTSWLLLCLLLLRTGTSLLLFQHRGLESDRSKSVA